MVRASLKRFRFRVDTDKTLGEELSSKEREVIVRKEKKEKALRLPVFRIKLVWKF